MKKISHGCTLDCADCCKFNVYVKNDDIIKIEGDKEHPYTKGFICKKGLAHLKRLNHSKRIYKPLIKINDKWKEIEFDEAINIMVKKLSYYKSKFGSKSILYYEQYGNGTVLKSIGEKFFNFYGGVSLSKGGPCWSAGIAAQKLDFGDSRSHSLEDMLNSKNIFVWGKNPANTTIHTMQMIKMAKEKGSKIIVIDPIETAAAKLADKYIKIKANGDKALALAMAQIIIKNKLYDEKYIKLYVNGFEEYKSYILSLNIKDLSKECGVEISTIEELVKLYCQKYSTILLGFGMQKYKNGGMTIRLIDALGAITGQIGFSGGGVNYANKVYPKILNTDPYDSEKFSSNRYYHTNEISEFIEKCNLGNTYYKNDIFINHEDNKGDYELNIPIKMAIITKSNLLNQLANINNLKRALSKVEFKVCFDMFITDTVKECDLFIPVTSQLESEDLLFSSMMNPYLVYNEKILEPQEKLMDEYYFFMEVAKRLKMSNYPIVTKKEYLEKVIYPLKNINSDISLEYLKNNYFTLHKDVAWSDKNFVNESGKFEIINCEEIKKFEANKYKDISKLRLLTNHGRDSLSSQHFMDDDGIAIAYINEKEAKRFNINNNEIIYLKSENGQIKVKINIDKSIGDNIVMMFVGWWERHGNPNFLTNSGISDIGGQITYNETFVEIIKR
ncbi:molybdopterin-dependent oxidoreductase [uncultured Clostridium sp.]|jgi:anaerobic selenocysteine-containing dehydrogenase|uniref:molybdopterin-dependent oxidoreductase n=1 Tax=uncultured Clostridium sp. TaxID=59620 RepID=UPI0026014F21|nr:molybdopterin-dependent oxidoreductase [uncultured Clostridium sp.]